MSIKELLAWLLGTVLLPTSQIFRKTKEQELTGFIVLVLPNHWQGWLNPNVNQRNAFSIKRKSSKLMGMAFQRRIVCVFLHYMLQHIIMCPARQVEALSWPQILVKCGMSLILLLLKRPPLLFMTKSRFPNSSHLFCPRGGNTLGECAMQAASIGAPDWLSTRLLVCYISSRLSGCPRTGWD